MLPPTNAFPDLTTQEDIFPSSDPPQKVIYSLLTITLFYPVLQLFYTPAFLYILDSHLFEARSCIFIILSPEHDIWKLVFQDISEIN